MNRNLVAIERAQEFTIRNCRATVGCPISWSKLTPTTDPEIRACSTCQQNVFRCQGADEVETHVKAGHCVAVFAEDGAKPLFLGKMEVDYRTADKLRW